MKNIFVSIFASYTSKLPKGKVNLWEWLLRENEYTPTVMLIRTISDKKERNAIKSRLPAITPSGIFSERKADKLIEHSGIICIDIDGKDNPQITDYEILKLELSKNSYILYCGLSVSGNGLFCIIPIAYPEKHKQHFYALEKDFKNMGITIDPSCSDLCRLRGYSFDKAPYVNPNAEIYSTVMEKEHFESNHHRFEKIVIKQKSEDLKFQQESQSVKSILLQPTKGYVQALTMSKTEKVKGLVERVIESKTDITGAYSDWIAICGIIKNLFGEDGRNLFHQISKFYPNYAVEESDEKYSSIKRWEYKYNSDQIFRIAAKYGLS